MEMRKQLTLILYIIVNILNMFTALRTAAKKCYQTDIDRKAPTNRVFLQVENIN